MRSLLVSSVPQLYLAEGVLNSSSRPLQLQNVGYFQPPPFWHPPAALDKLIDNATKPKSKAPPLAQDARNGAPTL